MRGRAAGRRRGQRGQVLILFALCAVLLFGMAALAIDGSFGLVQNRRAQNAADFAAFAGAQQLGGTTICNGPGTAPSLAQMVSVVQDVINANAPAVGFSWTGTFLDAEGRPIPGSGFTAASGSGGTYPPPGACGLSVDASPSWNTFLAGILGYRTLTGSATAQVSNTTKGSDVSIVALNKVGPHTVLGGGSGSFVVEGDMYLNTLVSNQPWTQPGSKWAYDDAVDAKGNSNIHVYGTIHSAQGTHDGLPLWPLDQCFRDVPPQGEGTSVPGDPTGPPATPLWNPPCSDSGADVTVEYNHIDPSWTPINDPLQSAGAPADPALSSTDIACPGLAMHTYASLAAGETTVSGVTTLLPGEYTSPVRITGSAVFGDCSAYPGEPAYPGIYRFDDGLWIDPAAGARVTATNVVLSFRNPYPVAGNVPGHVVGGTFEATGSGNGAPCLPPTTMSSSTSGAGGVPQAETSAPTAPCGGTSPQEYGVTAFGDSSLVPSGLYGTGENYSLLVGGAGSVSLTGPAVGEYASTGGNPGLILYQDPSVQANFGFDGEPGDSATISIAGVIYDASLAGYGSSAPQDYWDARNGGIPFYAGGTMQSGNGADWSSGGPPESSGSVTVTGTCIVDQFNTDGQTTVTIAGRPFALPGASTATLIG